VTETCRKALRIVSVLAIIAATPTFAAEKDATFESAARILTRAMKDAKDTPLSQTRESGQIITALRSTKDPALLPLFTRIRQSEHLENQIYGMIASTILQKDSSKLDLKLLTKSTDNSLVGSAIATLIDNESISDEQLQQLAKDATQEVQRAMALGELSRRKKLTDREPLVQLLKSNENVVRYYAAITLLEAKDSPEVPAALQVLRDLNDKHDLKQAPVQAMMIVRVQKEKITAAGPWLVQMAADEKNDDGLRYTAVSALLILKHGDGPRVLAEMIQKQKDTIQQVKLGLIALEFASDLKPQMMSPLLQSRSELAKSVATLAQQAADPNAGDNTPGLLKLIKEGHPIVLDWALAASERSDADRKMAVRSAVINQATIVDEQRGRDYERAAIAAQRVLEDGGERGRKLIASLISPENRNRAIAEAVLAGVYRSTETKKADLVLPAWDSISRSVNEETAANYAALILAREGRIEAKAWLSGMVMGGTVQSQGFRALAGWYYAKLLNQIDELVKRAVAG
jgi:hypothetical protein